MKILILYQSPWWNATAYYGVTLAYGLRKAGFEVWFGTDKRSPAGAKAAEKGVKLVHLSLNAKNPFRVLLEVRRLALFIHSEKIDIVDTLSPPGHLYHLLAARIYGARAPLVRTCCDARAPNANAVNKYLYRKHARRLIFPCAANYDRYYGVLRFPPQRSSIIYPAIDLENYDRNKPAHELRRKFKIDKKTPVIGIVARLSPEKGHKHFLHVAAKVAAKVKNVHFAVVGKEEQVSVDSLREIAAALGIQDKVAFAGFYPDVRGIIEECTIGVITSRFSETVCRTALEFFSANKPVIATNVNVLAEIIQPGKTGNVYEIDDVNGMAAGIVSLLNDPEMCARWGDNARKSVDDLYNLNKCTDDTVKVFNAVLDEVKSGG